MGHDVRGGSGTSLGRPPSRVVHCADALPWLSTTLDFAGCSFITSLPDLSELPALSVEEWRAWFSAAAALMCRRCPDEGVVIFYQSDVKRDGVWIDKGALVSRAAESADLALLWHKIVCRHPPGTVTYGRAGYSHLLCFSKGRRVDLAHATADVLAEAGPSPWTRGMGELACRVACTFVRDHTPTRAIVDPFCGRGTVLAVANDLGLDAVGVEISKKRARRAQSLTMEGVRRRPTARPEELDGPSEGETDD